MNFESQSSERAAGPAPEKPDPRLVIEAMLQAVNDHQLEALAGSFHPDYVNETPSHPERSFQGNAQVKKNWARIFASVPDVTARLVHGTVDGERVWVELEMSGTNVDGGAFLMRGVVIFTVTDDLIRSARFYMEPAEDTSGDVDAALRRVTRSSADEAPRHAQIGSASTQSLDAAR